MAAVKKFEYDREPKAANRHYQTAAHRGVVSITAGQYCKYFFAEFVRMPRVLRTNQLSLTGEQNRSKKRNPRCHGRSVVNET